MEGPNLSKASAWQGLYQDVLVETNPQRLTLLGAVQSALCVAEQISPKSGEMLRLIRFGRPSRFITGIDA
jgi:hypothetical protein